MDEVYLDVIYNKKGNFSVILIVRDIWVRIREKIGLNVFVGIFINKFVVKIVSDINKFNG